MENKQLMNLSCYSVAEKAELFQSLAQALFTTPGSTDPILIRTATGAVLGYFVPANRGNEAEIDLNAGVAELSDPNSLVPIEEVLAESLPPT